MWRKGGPVKRQVYSVIYWIAGLVIALGAFGHGIGGARNVRAAFAASTLDPHVESIIWVVWYWVSGTMLLFGALALWAWFAARRGSREVLVVPIVIALFYMITGAVTTAIERDAFWLLFLFEGVLLLVSTVGLKRAA
jgi:hypothetical protein